LASAALNGALLRQKSFENSGIIFRISHQHLTVLFFTFISNDFQCSNFGKFLF